MTFIGSLTELENRRASGQSPKGGVAPDFAELRLAIDMEPAVRLNELLKLQWNHPLDTSVMAVIVEITGVDSRNTILLAADHVWRESRNETPPAHATAAYCELRGKKIAD